MPSKRAWACPREKYLVYVTVLWLLHSIWPSSSRCIDILAIRTSVATMPDESFTSQSCLGITNDSNRLGSTDTLTLATFRSSVRAL